MTATTTPVPSPALPAGCSFAGANPAGGHTRSFGWRARWAAIGAAIAVVAGTGGVAFSGATNAQITPSQNLITPCRIMDTRSGPNNVGPRNTPLAGGETYSIQVTGTNGNCTIPTGTSGVVMNVTIVGPGANGFLTVFPGPTRPTASNINYTAGQPPVGDSGVTVGLSTTGQVSFFASGGPVNVIADIVSFTTAARLTNTQLTQNRWDQDLAKPATIPTGSEPSGVAFDGTNIWVANSASNSVSRYNPATNSAIGSPIAIGAGTGPWGLAFDGTNMWVTNSSSDSVSRINATTGVVGPTINVGAQPQAILFDGSTLWVANTGSNSVTRINPATASVIGAPITVGSTPWDLAFDGSVIWVTNNGSNSVTRLSSSTGANLGTPVAVGSSPRGIAFDGSTMWVANTAAGTLTRIRVATATVITPAITVGGDPRALAFDGSNLWITNDSANSVSRVDVATGAAVGSPIPVGTGPNGIEFDGTNMWVTNVDSANVTKLRVS